MLTLEQINQTRASRGPRWHVDWTIRQGEFGSAYARTSAEAEAIAERERRYGAYQITITPAVEYADVAAEARRIGADIREARRLLEDAMSRAAALAPVANDGGNGIPELTLSYSLGVDRMTVRKWLGKRDRTGAAKQPGAAL